MTVYHENAAALQEAMRDRRAQLDFIQSAVPDRGGPSVSLYKRFELGEIPPAVEDRTLAKIDAVLRGSDGQWPSGTARRILNGQDQDPPVDLNRLQEFTSAVTRMQRMLARVATTLPPELLAAMNDVSLKQLDLITDLNERNSTR